MLLLERLLRVKYPQMRRFHREQARLSSSMVTRDAALFQCLGSAIDDFGASSRELATVAFLIAKSLLVIRCSRNS
ncbi:hypothetical protein [Pseudomonas sp. R5(2019)]|uniref:hypothetical protein n=1 Tax=Pseudomonas sp. R5(2019) TaxID=2697566 RepID=UPI0014133D44|nr:hypothetical protein [Pseudomonas sp. R5(2019)]NBA96777.1 hypothetical protein [Pseudomonas sp. R5(2019)]